MTTEKAFHIPVMMSEMIEYFAGTSIKVFFDGTLGAGGHARAMLEAHPEIEMYIGCDRDQMALAIAKENLSEFEHKMKFVQGNFLDLDQMIASVGVKQVDGFFLT
jgi:16S rRNA (cytosine1402-N4)-methyltransferase